MQRDLHTFGVACDEENSLERRSSAVSQVDRRRRCRRAIVRLGRMQQTRTDRAAPRRYTHGGTARSGHDARGISCNRAGCNSCGTYACRDARSRATRSGQRRPPASRRNRFGGESAGVSPRRIHGRRLEVSTARRRSGMSQMRTVPRSTRRSLGTLQHILCEPGERQRMVYGVRGQSLRTTLLNFRSRMLPGGPPT